MHSSATFLAPALSLASSVSARPQQGQYGGQQATTTFNGGYQVPQPSDAHSGGGSSKLPAKCSARCHISQPHALPSAGSQQTLVDGDGDGNDSYLPQPAPIQGDNGYQQPTPSEDGPVGQQQPNQTLCGDYEQPTMIYDGDYSNPVETPYRAYGQEDDDDDY